MKTLLIALIITGLCAATVALAAGDPYAYLGSYLLGVDGKPLPMKPNSITLQVVPNPPGY